MRVPVKEPVIGSLQLPRSKTVVVLVGCSVGEVGEHHRDPARVSSRNRDPRRRADVLDPAAEKLLQGSDGALTEEWMCSVVVPQDEANAPVEASEGVCDFSGVLEGEIAEVPDDVLSAHNTVPCGDDVVVVSVNVLEGDVVPGILAGGRARDGTRSAGGRNGCRQ